MPNLDFYYDTLSDDTNDTLGGRLSAARDLAALSLESLAARLGVDRDIVHTWESDRAAPEPSRLSDLASVLGVSPMWLMTGVGEGPEDGEAETTRSWLH